MRSTRRALRSYLVRTGARYLYGGSLQRVYKVLYRPAARGAQPSPAHTAACWSHQKDKGDTGMEGWMPFAARATRQNKRLIVLDPFRIPLFFVALCLSATKPKHRVIPCPLIVPRYLSPTYCNTLLGVVVTMSDQSATADAMQRPALHNMEQQ